MDMNYKLAVYIGRFSPFHKGHHQTLLSGFDIAPKVLVLVGSCFPNRTLKIHSHLKNANK